METEVTPLAEPVATVAEGLALPPGILLIAAGLLLLALRGRLRDGVILLAPVLALALVWLLPEGGALGLPYLGYDLVLAHGDTLSRLFGTVFTIAAFAGGLFALRQERHAEMVAAFVYAGAALGVVFAGDLVTLFVFWEIMAIASTMVIWLAGPKARGAGLRYVIIHLFGGVILMAGIAWHVSATGSIAFTDLTESPAKWLILGGFMLNAGAPPLSAWVADAYPRSSWSGMVFLSAFTTKTAVFVLMRGFPGEAFLIWIGLYMIFYGIVYAILENDIRRIFAYSIVNQVGFMVVGIGIGTEMALNGVAAHAFAHIIYKALLLTAAGSVIYMTGRSRFTELGGLARTMPVTAACGIIGALSISALPLTSGFVSKTMITEGAIGEQMFVVWLLLTAASAGSMLYAGVKFPWLVFFSKDSGLRPTDPPTSMRTAMILLAVLCIGIGVVPGALYALLPTPVDYVPYTGPHVISKLQLLLFAGAAAFVMLRWLRPGDTVTLDIDWLWRQWPVRAAARAPRRTPVQATSEAMHAAYQRILDIVYRAHGPSGILARSWPTGSMAFWATLLLGAFMLLYYLG